MSRTTIKNREGVDFYPTPPYAVDLILSRICIDKVITSLEPCSGNGVISSRLPGKVYTTEITEGIDYFDINFDVDLIVTNPPFNRAIEFLSKSLTECKTCCYLLRINFLGGQNRYKFWSDNPPTHLYALSKRPFADATEYAWYVWDRRGLMIDDPGIYVLGDERHGVEIDPDEL